MLSFYISFLVNQKPFISLQTDKKLAELCNGLVREAILYYIVGGGGGVGEMEENVKTCKLFSRKLPTLIQSWGLQYSCSALIKIVPCNFLLHC